MNDLKTVSTTSPDESADAYGAEITALRRDDFDRDVWCVLGLPIDIADVTQAVAAIDDAARTRQQLSFVTPNINWLVRAMRDDAVRRETLDTDLSLVDGVPLLAMAKLLGVPVPSRVAGSDLFDALRRRPGFAGRKLKVFFFGGRDGAAESAAAAVNKEDRGVEATGWRNPGFGDVESMSDAATIDAINAANPDFVVVALGAAKGHAWVHRNRARLNAPVTAHLGAVVDFVAGGIARAPKWMQRAGLEWLWRIKEEPALWRRYAGDAAALAKIALKNIAPQLGRAQISTSSKAEVSVENAPALTLVKVSGDIGQANLRPVREAFRWAAQRGVTTRLDFSALGDFDRSFLGQILMLEKHLVRAGAQLQINGTSKAHQDIMRANMMVYSAGAAETFDSAASTVRKTAV